MIKYSIFNLLILCFFFCLISTSNAQQLTSIYQQGGKVDTLKNYNVDSITFNNEQSQRIMKVNFNNGLTSEYYTSSIDSMIFTKRSMISKQGFVLFRVDDTQLSTDIIPMSRVFDKFGYKMVNLFNPSIATKDEIDAIKLFQSNGHEITDHTPNHTTAYADLKSEDQKKLFIGRSGIERIDGLRVYFDWVYPDKATCAVGKDSIIITAGSEIIKGNFTNCSTSQQVYTNELGWVLLRNISATQATAFHAKSRQVVTFTKSSKEQLYIVESYSVYPTVDAMKSLMLASELLFNEFGIDYYKYWCMCGGTWAIGRGDIIRDAAITSGYVGGSEHSTPNGNIPLTYNQNNPLSKWSSQVASIISELNTPLQTKKLIANEIAKHHGVVITGHMWYYDATYTTLYRGTRSEKLDQYLKDVEEILKFCYDNDIPVLTYRDVNKVLYESISDSTTNVMPPLYKDLTSQGFPDGYTLYPNVQLYKNIGVPEDKGCALGINGGEMIFYIENIGGFEKGENTFSFYAKGTDNAILTITLNDVKLAKTYSSIKIPIKGALNSFVKFNTKINIPNNTDLFTIYCKISGNVNPNFYISGMYLGKNKE